LAENSYFIDDVPPIAGLGRASLDRSPLHNHETSLVSHLEREDFTRLVGALFGAAIGCAAALALACLIFPTPGAGYDPVRRSTLEWARSWGRQEEREMAFFVFALIFGESLGCVGAASCIAGRRLTLFGLLRAPQVPSRATRNYGLARPSVAR
jgi:hypothetical protein